LQADYVTVVEDRPIMSAKYPIPVLFFHFWPKLTHPAARSLCDSWASCQVSSQNSDIALDSDPDFLNEISNLAIRW